jgi:pimeloyl-ACP methyl ester carboxylesterase
MMQAAVFMIRKFVKVSSRVSPRLTGNLAFKAFCRPSLLRNLDDGQKKLIARAEQRFAEAERKTIAFFGGELQTYRFRHRGENSRGVVVLVHGWTGRAAFMSAFVSPLLQAGYEVLAVDLPAHGNSSGKTLHVALGVQALTALHTETGPWKAIVAHSFGGAIVTALVSGAVVGSAPVSTEKLVLIAAPSSIPELFKNYGNTIGLTPRSQYWLEENVTRLAGRSLSAFEGEQLLKLTTAQTLLLHAPDDKEVPFHEAERLATAGDHVTLRPMPGVGHRRILYAPKTIEAVSGFLGN